MQALADEVVTYASRRRPVLNVGGPRARYVLRRLPVMTERPPSPTLVSTRNLIAGLARGAHEPVLDLTGLSVLYVEGAPTVIPIAVNTGPITEALERSGLSFERRTVPLNVVVVTGIERPKLDVVDR